MLGPEDVVEILAVDLLGMVPEDEAVVVSTNRGLPLVMDGNHPAGKAFLNIAARLCGEDVPMNDVQEDRGIWARIMRFVRQG
jgi:septum site-determining protein MinD